MRMPEAMARFWPILPFIACLALAGCETAASNRVNGAQPSGDLARFDKADICSPAVKETARVEQERKRRKLPPCNQKAADQEKRPEGTDKFNWLLLLFLLATPAGA